MSAFIDLTGQRFGRLVVIAKTDERKGRSVVWECKCDCGNIVRVSSSSLRHGDTKSCGCLHREMVSKMMTTHGACTDSAKGAKRERLYGVWAGMITRTSNPNATNYKYYGGRGITVCDEWHDYAVFRDWALQHGYNEEATYGKCTLDRINDDGNYEPENCRWVDQFVQANNQRSNVYLEYNGESHNLKTWSEIVGLNYETFRMRLRRGSTLEEIIKDRIPSYAKQ